MEWSGRKFAVQLSSKRACWCTHGRHADHHGSIDPLDALRCCGVHQLLFESCQFSHVQALSLFRERYRRPYQELGLWPIAHRTGLVFFKIAGCWATEMLRTAEKLSESGFFGDRHEATP